MKAFLDTSSLIKLYHTEVGSDFVMNALSQDITEIFLSELQFWNSVLPYGRKCEKRR